MSKKPYRRYSKRSKRGSSSYVRKIVKSEIHKESEKKYLPALILSSFSTTATIASLCDVIQGNTDQQRDGDQLYMLSLEIRLYTVAADIFNVLRLIVFQWFPNTVPLSSQLLFDPANGITSPYNHDQRYQFRVLYDKTNITGADWHAAQLMHRYITKIPHRKVQYVNASIVGTNKLYYYIVSDSGVAPHPSVAGYFKMNYKDF